MAVVDVIALERCETVPALVRPDLNGCAPAFRGQLPDAPFIVRHTRQEAALSIDDSAEPARRQQMLIEQLAEFLVAHGQLQRPDHLPIALDRHREHGDRFPRYSTEEDVGELWLPGFEYSSNQVRLRMAGDHGARRQIAEQLSGRIRTHQA